MKTSSSSKKIKQPMHTSTPTPRRTLTPVRSAASKSSATSPVPTAVEGIEQSPFQLRRSPRKSKQQLFPPTAPRKHCHIFEVCSDSSVCECQSNSCFVLFIQGCVFLLTYIEPQAQPKERRNESTDVTDESVIEGTLTFNHSSLFQTRVRPWLQASVHVASL